MADKILNVVHVSDRYRQIDANRSDPFSRDVTNLGIEFLCAASFLRGEYKKDHWINQKALEDVKTVGAQLAGIARFFGYSGLVVPHHTMTSQGRMIKHAVCPELAKAFGIGVRCQPIGYVPLMNPDTGVKTCLSDGLRGYTGAVPRIASLLALEKRVA